jgi:hypothetical protein
VLCSAEDCESQPDRNNSMQTSWALFFRRLYGSTILLLAMHSVYVMSRVIDVQIARSRYMGVLNMDQEASIATWFNSFVLLLVALLATWLAAQPEGDGQKRSWRIIGLLFLLLSIDEISATHELWNGHLNSRLNLPPTLVFSWMLVGALIALCLAIYFARFVFSLPKPIRNGILGAAALYCGGALGLEAVGSYLFGNQMGNTVWYAAVIGLEETCEILGAIRMAETLGQAAFERSELVTFSFVAK